MHATQEQIIDDTKIMHLNCDIGTAYKESTLETTLILLKDNFELTNHQNCRLRLSK